VVAILFVMPAPVALPVVELLYWFSSEEPSLVGLVHLLLAPASEPRMISVMLVQQGAQLSFAEEAQFVGAPVLQLQLPVQRLMMISATPVQQGALLPFASGVEGQLVGVRVLLLPGKPLMMVSVMPVQKGAGVYLLEGKSLNALAALLHLLAQ